jgi:hypothetical protein
MKIDGEQLGLPNLKMVDLSMARLNNQMVTQTDLVSEVAQILGRLCQANLNDPATG